MARSKIVMMKKINPLTPINMNTPTFPERMFLSQEHNDFLKTRAGLKHLLRYPRSMSVVLAISLSRESYLKNVE